MKLIKREAIYMFHGKPLTKKQIKQSFKRKKFTIKQTKCF